MYVYVCITNIYYDICIYIHLDRENLTCNRIIIIYLGKFCDIRNSFIWVFLKQNLKFKNLVLKNIIYQVKQI